MLLVTCKTEAKPPVKFTPDQCRVLKQFNIDTNGLCPLSKASKKKSKSVAVQKANQGR